MESCNDPTAKHRPWPVHDTLLKVLSHAPAGLGVAIIDHREPFHRSASGVLFPEWSRTDPTATHSPRELHDTSRRTLLRGAVGFGLGWIDHAVPFQRSVSGIEWVVSPLEEPTAMHLADEMHETPNSLAPTAAAGLGTGCGDQFGVRAAWARVAGSASSRHTAIPAMTICALRSPRAETRRLAL